MGHKCGHENLVLSKREDEVAQQVADIYGVTKEEAAELIIKQSLADRVRNRTGKGPAKVYSIPRKAS
jgi:hypothetical protein